jgi:hypothetical protein
MATDIRALAASDIGKAASVGVKGAETGLKATEKGLKTTGRGLKETAAPVGEKLQARAIDQIEMAYREAAGSTLTYQESACSIYVPPQGNGS